MNKLYMTVGIPGSCKSHWAETHKNELNAVIHSSDDIRAEMGNVNEQSKNAEVFQILHQRIKDDLKAGKNVVYDATGISRKRRINFISNELRDIPCEKICILFATPYEICCDNNKKRERKVPEEVLTRMYKNFEVPCLQEGFDDIQIVWWDYKENGLEYNFYKDLEKWRNISQDSHHHTKSIGDHMIAASNHYSTMCEHSEDWNTEDKLLSMAILMHDCGKVFCKGYLDSKGNVSETAKYYNHHNVGSFLSLFYLKEMNEYSNIFNFTDDEILYISLLINCHMRYFMAYKDSDKARERDRQIFGDEFMLQLGVLHECDLAAH